MQSGVILGVTGSFTGVDASGRFKQATLFEMSARSSGGGGKGQGSGSGASGAMQHPAKKKQKVFDGSGAWNGCCYCGAKGKVNGVEG